MWGPATISALCFIGATIVVCPVSSEPVGDTAKDAAYGLVPPFAAAATRSVPVRLRPDSASPEVGLLHEGATVSVSACAPDCAAPHAWAIIGVDAAVSLEALALPRSAGSAAPAAPTPETLWYGRVGKSGIKIFKEPRLDGPIVTRKRLSREMAFLPDVELRKNGWLERAEGGFVRLRRVQILTPSRFQGELRPRLPIAFVVRELPGNDRASALHRYDRVSVGDIGSVRVTTDRGPVPRSALRIIAWHSPPRSLPPGAKWVLVDLSQQTLTAYEGDIAVYATLISSGTNQEKSQTNAGLFQVEHKMAYSDMHGQLDDPYDVDRVPYTLYYHKNEALHGTYWHDRFGARASHGCVNLALADARWLFDWAPPQLPENWFAINPQEAGVTSLWVLVEEKAPLGPVTQISQAALQ